MIGDDDSTDVLTKSWFVLHLKKMYYLSLDVIVHVLKGDLGQCSANVVGRRLLRWRFRNGSCHRNVDPFSDI